MAFHFQQRGLVFMMSDCGAVSPPLRPDIGLAWAGIRMAAADMAQTALAITRVRDIADTPFGLGLEGEARGAHDAGARARNTLSA
jgi:hypothetical protein